MNSSDALAAAVFALQSQVKTLGRADQLTSSTVGAAGDDAVAVGDAVADAAITNDAVPALQDDVADAGESSSDLAAILQATSEDLDARFADAAVDLANAQEELEDAQQQIREAFGQQLEGIAADIDTAIKAANGASLILYSKDRPPSNDLDHAPTGSTFFLIDENENISGEWQQTGTVEAPIWTPRQVLSQVIANLDVGKLTAGQASIAELVAQKIAAATASFQTANIANLFVTENATMKQAVIDYLFANVVKAKLIEVDTLNGVTLTGVSVQTGTTGARVVLSGASVRFFDANNKRAGAIRGQSNGEAGGLIQIGPVDESGGISVGTYYLPLSGTAAVHADSAHIGQLYVDQLINPATNGPFSGVYIGTRTQSIGNATGPQGVGAFNNVPGTETSFMTMGPDGRFTLAPGSYVITITMTLNEGKATGRTFLELVDMVDTGVPLFRNLIPPNVGEDTVSSAGTVYTNGNRTFRVQTFQTSGAPNSTKYTLGVTRIS